MNKRKKIILGLGTLALILGFSGVVANSANAFMGNANIKNPNYSTERKAAIDKAFASNDYDSWKALMQNQGGVMQVINKDNFAKFAEAHRLAQSGDIAGAQKIRQELGLGSYGLGLGRGMMNGLRGGFGRGNCLNY